jgi:hypothetical protein
MNSFKKTILFFAVVFPALAIGQRKDNIKIDALSLFRKTVKVSWEHFDTPTTSTSLYTQLSDNVYWDDSNQRLLRLGVGLERRFYLGKKINYSGLYLSTQLRFQHLHYDGTYDIYEPLTYEMSTASVSKTINTLGYGVQFGYQELTIKDGKSAIDMSLGFIWNTGSGAIRQLGQQDIYLDNKFTGLVGVFPQATFAWSFGL